MPPTASRLYGIVAAALLAALPPTPGCATELAAAPALPDLLSADMNSAVNPGADFFDYANGGWLARNPIPATESWRGVGKLVSEQLTPLQRYFLGYALGWMMKEREESLRASLLSDVHAPAKWRVLGPLANVPEFYEAFGVKPGQPMWRPEAERVQIW